MPILDLERRNHHLRRFLVEHELEPTDVTAVGFVASQAGQRQGIGCKRLPHG